MRNSSKVSSRSRRKIVQIQNQNAKIANNLVQSYYADNSSIVYTSGAQPAAHGPHVVREGILCGPLRIF
jgi:hypothetical protein